MTRSTSNAAAAAGRAATQAAAEVEAAAKLEAENAEREAKAETERQEQADAADAAEAPNGMVRVRVLPNGDGKVFTGETRAGANVDEGEEVHPTYKKGARFNVATKIARELEDRGFVEIQD